MTEAMQARALLLAILLAAPALSGCVLDELIGSTRTEPTLSPAAFLRDEPYPDLIVEIDHTDDYEPTQEAISVLERALRNVTDKRSIVFTQPQQIRDLPEQQNNTELIEAHRATLDRGDNETAAILHVLYVNGEYEETPGAIGLAFAAGRIAPVFLYAEQIKELQTASEIPDLPLPQDPQNPAPEKVERAVLVHEAGHVLGLVNNGAPMATDREDQDHPRHSQNEDSVMYWAVENNRALFEMFQDGEHIPYHFDTNDEEDLRRVREGIVEPERPGDVRGG